MGRIDDVVNVSGHRIGTAEVESALVSHPKVAEAAVTPMPHEIKGTDRHLDFSRKGVCLQSISLQPHIFPPFPRCRHLYPE
jgi:non-ribosomal peptide synthetase component E (peptide arylation enzyme)